MKHILPKIKNYKFVSLVVLSVVIASVFGSCVPTANHDVTVKLYLPESNNASSSDINALANCELTTSFVGAYNANTGATAISDVAATADPALYAGISSGDSVLTFNGTPELKVKTGKGWNFYYFGTFGLTGCSTGQSVISFGEVRDVDISAETSLGLEVMTPNQAVSQTGAVTVPVGFVNVKFRWTGSGSTSCASSGAVHLAFPSLNKKGTATSGIPYSVTGQTTGLAELDFGPIPKNLIYEAKVNQTSPDTREMKFLFNTFAETNVDSLVIDVPSSASGFCQGAAVSPASLAISDGATFNFGTAAANTSTDKTFTITHSGGSSATSIAGSGLATPFTFKGGSFPGTGGTCTTTLASGTCTMVVTFNSSSVGAASDTIIVSYNDGAASTSATRDVTGTAVNIATLAITNATTNNFGTVAQSASSDLTFVVTNSGLASATSVVGGGLASPYTFKGGSFPGTGGSCSGTLGASASCTTVVNFAPVAPGTFPDSIEIGYNNGVTSVSATHAITGTAPAIADMTISDGPTYNYGGVSSSTTADKLFTLTNNSPSVTLSSITINGLAAPFSDNGGGTCTPILTPLDSCTIEIRFAPLSPGAVSDTIEVDFLGTMGPTTETRDITGTGL